MVFLNTKMKKSKISMIRIYFDFCFMLITISEIRKSFSIQVWIRYNYNVTTSKWWPTWWKTADCTIFCAHNFEWIILFVDYRKNKRIWICNILTRWIPCFLCESPKNVVWSSDNIFGGCSDSEYGSNELNFWYMTKCVQFMTFNSPFLNRVIFWSFLIFIINRLHIIPKKILKEFL